MKKLDSYSFFFFLTRYIHVSVHPDKEFRQSDKCKMIICCLEETQNRSYALEIFESSAKKNLNDFFLSPRMIAYWNIRMTRCSFFVSSSFSQQIGEYKLWKIPLKIQVCFFQVPSARLCQLWCDQNEECQYFTWWSEGMFQNICFHHKECTKLDFECVNCHAGPRSSGCPRRRNNGFNWN